MPTSTQGIPRHRQPNSGEYGHVTPFDRDRLGRLAARAYAVCGVQDDRGARAIRKDRSTFGKYRRGDVASPLSTLLEHRWDLERSGVSTSSFDAVQRSTVIQVRLAPLTMEQRIERALELSQREEETNGPLNMKQLRAAACFGSVCLNTYAERLTQQAAVTEELLAVIELILKGGRP